jgi:3-oxoacyl-[acyl-carrier-protein] synthase-3
MSAFPSSGTISRRSAARASTCFCAAAAERTGSGPSDYILPHQANGRMDAILAAPLGLPPERIVVTADRLGNTGSAAIWLALAQLRPGLKSGQTALALGAEATDFMFGGFRYHHG